MKAGKYNIKELFSNNNIESVIIPEIQRDYVWGKDQVEGLLQSITDDFLKFQGSSETITLDAMEDKGIENALVEYYRTIKYSSSIGFIYAYSDFEYPDKYFLIDGQQRLTTIYLLLVVIASRNEKFKEQFVKKYLRNGKSFIEYRVREASLLFLNQAITHILQKGNYDLKDQHWYYNFYQNDKTIYSIINNLRVIDDFLEKNIDPIDDFLYYLLNHVRFWYFDTNISEQGEELYVYMNARGERMQSNENLKAELLSQIPDPEKNGWGRKWEEWQGVFWLLRGEHENADNVFNEFIYCISGLENQKKGLGIFKKNFNKGHDYPTHPELLKCFENDGLVTIEKYVNALQLFLSDDFKSRCTGFGLYANWIDLTRKEVVRLFNKTNTNWFIKVNDQDRSTEQNRMVLVWGILELLYGCEKIELSTIISIRIVYNRFHNFIRAVLNNLSDAARLRVNGYASVVENNSNEEEILKYQYLISVEKAHNFNMVLSAIWELEDHPINLDGRNLKNINSIHLINYGLNPDLAKLNLIKTKFYELFPLDGDGVDWVNYKSIITCLISYGKFWEEKVTNGYDNLNFNSEKRIVRDIDSFEDRCFHNFFSDYLKSNALEELVSKQLVEPYYNRDTNDWKEAIQWYSYHLRDKMWYQGNYYIAMGNYNYLKNDKYFPNFWQLVNTKGNFNGGEPKVLHKKVRINSV